MSNAENLTRLGATATEARAVDPDAIAAYYREQHEQQVRMECLKIAAERVPVSKIVEQAGKLYAFVKGE